MRDAGLVEQTQGWALVGETLLWTADGGLSWQHITPSRDDDLVILRAFFLDANQGWAAFAPQPECCPESVTIHILHTGDGGLTWQESSLDVDLPFGVFGGVIDLGFLDSVNGWLVVDQTATMNSSAADLYRTTDGGLTWQPLPLPFSGPARFITPSTGWTIGSCCTGAPRQLYRTTDGGLTWEQQAIAPNPVDDGFDYHDYQLPTFFNELDGLVGITLRDQAYGVSGVGVYRTDDGGESWRLEAALPILQPLAFGEGRSLPAQFPGQDHWIIAMGNSIHMTRDGGETWDEFLQAGLPGRHDRLHFVTEQTGWSLVFEDNCGSDCLLLFQTSDGGETWNPVSMGE